jgi:hypothetical protein
MNNKFIFSLILQILIMQASHCPESIQIWNFELRAKMAPILVDSQSTAEASTIPTEFYAIVSDPHTIHIEGHAMASDPHMKSPSRCIFY